MFAKLILFCSRIDQDDKIKDLNSEVLSHDVDAEFDNDTVASPNNKHSVKGLNGLTKFDGIFQTANNTQSGFSNSTHKSQEFANSKINLKSNTLKIIKSVF